MTKQVLIGLAIIAALFAAACGSKTPAPAPTFFPETNQAPGWAKTAETRVFPADKLWEYNDGDAERYLQAGVEKTLTADYRYKDKFDAVADVHVMRAPEGAKKVFDSDSAVGSESLNVGDAGRRWQGSLAFVTGRYYVHLTAYEQQDPEVGTALEGLARAIEKRLAQN
jgi:Family of unknown function (DUF6599)